MHPEKMRRACLDSSAFFLPRRKAEKRTSHIANILEKMYLFFFGDPSNKMQTLLCAKPICRMPLEVHSRIHIQNRLENNSLACNSLMVGLACLFTNPFAREPRQKRGSQIQFMVGLTGFEPATFASRTRRSTKLSHNPICLTICKRWI